MHTSGFSDPEVYGWLRLLGLPRLSGGLGRRTSVSLFAGVKTPWGRTMSEKGERVDEHVQPGTGSTDGFGGLVHPAPRSPVGGLCVGPVPPHGEERRGYRYGPTHVNLAYEHKLGSRLDGAEAELPPREERPRRWRRRCSRGEDTGGSLLYLTPRLLAVGLGHGLVLRAGAQIPVAKSLNGYQTERANVNVGLTYLF